MKEILQVQVGQCGNQVGSQFWEAVRSEHGLDEAGVFRGEREYLLDRISVYFNEKMDKFRPRSVLVDLEPGVVERVGRNFIPENCITSHSGAGNNWARAHYGEGAQLLVQVEDAVRREVEQCDLLQGFQLIHSLGGGTGSGLGSLVLQSVSDQFPGRIINTFSVLPSLSASESLVEPYNAGLSLHQLLQHSHGVFCADNGALTSLCSHKLNIPRPSHSDLNLLLARMMVSVTAPLRLPSSLSTDLRKMATSLVPLPRLHLFISSLAPLTSSPHLGAGPLLSQLFDGSNVLTDCDVRQGRFLTASSVVRGSHSAMELCHLLSSVVDTRSQNFVPWIPDNVMMNTCQGGTGTVSGTVVGNSTAITQPLRVLSAKFSGMVRRRAFIHSFTTEGLEEQEFGEALSDIDNLISEYEFCQDVVEDVVQDDVEEDVEEDIQDDVEDDVEDDAKDVVKDDADDVSEFSQIT